MRRLGCALCLPLLLAAQPAETPLRRDWTRIQEWAGGSGAPAEFQLEKLEGFLAARRAELRTAKGQPWKAWLEGLAASRIPHLQAWARTRLVEAGVYGGYEDLLAAAVEHLRQSSRVGPKQSILRQPPGASGWMPGVFRIHPDSPYWVEVERQTRSRPDLEVNANLYAIWCQGSFPAQRALIFDIAAKVEAKVTVNSPKADPWNDPRLWIVSDWAMAWGSAEDFRTLEAQMPEGVARTAFARLHAALKDQPAFWAKPLGRAELKRRNGELAKAPASAEPAEAEDQPLAVLKEGPEPGYPPLARDRALQARLHLALTIDPEGRVAGWRPYPGPWVGIFTPWAAPSVVLHRFQPARKAGQAQWAASTLDLDFRLKDRIILPSHTGGRRGAPPFGGGQGW